MGSQPQRPSARALADEFAFFARRRLGEHGGNVVVSTDSLGPVSADTAILVAVGDCADAVTDGTQRSDGLTVAFTGTAGSGEPLSPVTPIAILDRWHEPDVGPVPDAFDVLAIVTVFNEIDIVEQLVDRLVDDGIRVHVIDNWSTDGSYELVAARASGPAVTVERFPAEGPSATFALGALLERVEVVAAESSADWIVHHDADEVRESPWPSRSLRDGIWVVDQLGFNAIDHTVVNFQPVDDSFEAGKRLEDSFAWFEFGAEDGSFRQVKAWRRQTEPASLHTTGGHEAAFRGRRVFPYKFLLRHYPIRSQAHGERKIFQDRVARWDPDERARGWHSHYDELERGTSFLRDPADLLAWDAEFPTRWLLERLSGAGLPGNPELAPRSHVLERQLDFLTGEVARLDAEAGRLEADRKRMEVERDRALANGAAAAGTLDRQLVEARAELDAVRQSKRWRIGGILLSPLSRLRRRGGR